MPKFFFNVHGGANPDLEGYELADLATAKMLAVQTACAIVGQGAGDFLDQGEWQMNVCDDHELVLFSLTFSTTDAPAVRTVTKPRPPSSPES